MKEYITSAEIGARNERAERYSCHAERCRYRRRILILQWASVAAVIFLFATAAYTLHIAGVI